MKHPARIYVSNDTPRSQVQQTGRWDEWGEPGDFNEYLHSDALHEKLNNDQVEIWGSELLEDMRDVVRDPTDYEDVIDINRVAQRAVRIVAAKLLDLS